MRLHFKLILFKGQLCFRGIKEGKGEKMLKPSDTSNSRSWYHFQDWKEPRKQQWELAL